MADVLIRGIEMPDNAEGCEVILRIQPNGEVLDAHKIHIGATAILLPEGHGKLIDMDKLKKLSYEIKTNRGTYQRVINIVDLLNAPTIVPVERGDN